LAWSNSGGKGYIYQLYIDDGVSNRGHRTNIINPALKMTGIAYCNHSKMSGMMAVVYAGGFTEKCSGSVNPVPQPEEPTPWEPTPVEPTPVEPEAPARGA